MNTCIYKDTQELCGLERVINPLRKPEKRSVINMTNTPRRLPTTTYKGTEYFIDDRLREFRPIDRPFEPIPFDSDLGREIDNACD